MIPTPEQIEAVARAMKEAVGAEGLDAVEEKAYRLMAVGALAAAHPFIRAEALEEAAKVTDHAGQQPTTGNLMHDTGWDGAALTIAAAIRALMDT